MNYRDNRAMQDRLAAEYALGNLRGLARKRFEGWMRDDAALRRTVMEWGERFAPMATAGESVRPRRRVWRRIASRIGQRPRRPPEIAQGAWRWGSGTFQSPVARIALIIALSLTATIVLRLY